ncbi:MAG: dTMP kinase [Candidatus Omnitrophica bacterium]|nr:dTMP kinase [Candidatus Omnitrophota bacterium]
MEICVKGKFITFEGSEGSGKSTQAALICEYLKKKKIPVLLLREPGGVKISEAIRGLLLDVKNTDMTKESETLLYMASRAQLVEEILKPALKKGTVVICDRFLDSTIAYQGFGNGVDINAIKKIGAFATQGIAPGLTLLFDIETEKGLSRTNVVKDRIELRSVNYHRRVRKGYLALAKSESKRIRVIKVDQGKEEIFEIVRKHIDKFLNL